MRRLLMGTLGLAGCLLASDPSGAVTLPQAASSRQTAVVLVDGGCGGPAFYRAPNGYCYRKPYAYAPPAYAPPVYRPPVYAPPYYGRPCGPGYHPTPYGCRPNW